MVTYFAPDSHHLVPKELVFDVHQLQLLQRQVLLPQELVAEIQLLEVLSVQLVDDELQEQVHVFIVRDDEVNCSVLQQHGNTLPRVEWDLVFLEYLWVEGVHVLPIHPKPRRYSPENKTSKLTDIEACTRLTLSVVTVVNTFLDLLLYSLFVILLFFNYTLPVNLKNELSIDLWYSVHDDNLGFILRQEQHAFE